MGTIVNNRAYRSRRDRLAGGFSVAVTIPGLNNWIIHMHCNADGTQATGENPTHYKHVLDASEVGVSIALTPRQIRGLIPGDAARRQAAAGLPAL